jgi:ParB family chromosome partitioning protein
VSTGGKPPRGLGRGLDALLPVRTPERREASYGDGNVFSCPLDKIRPHKGQPRQHFDAEALEELAQSLREHGLIEPLVVRRVAGGDDALRDTRSGEFEIVAGERRWRAAQKAGLREVMVVVRDVSARDAYELALIENIQREDLDSIEFAEALDRLIKEHGYTQETIAQRVGKDRSTIANALRLLKLPGRVRELVIQGELSEGHARALLGAPDELTLATLADKVVKGRLNVRQTEALVRAAKQQKGDGGSPKKPNKTAGVRDLEGRLERKLGTRCEVRDKDGKGEIVVKYSSWDELDRILESLL